ncbi:L-cystine-binding protein FliY [Microbacterium sp. Bi128]|nr:L-cystine-binding protein FliY [Microbacterium sp. Bi128]
MLSRPHSPEPTRGWTSRRVGAVLAAAAVLLSGLAPVGAATAAPLPEPVATYDFGDTTGTTVPDASGHGHDAVIRGTGFAVDGDALSLPGGAAGSSAAYVELPTGFFDGRSTVTVSAWLQDRTGAGNQAAMFFGTTENLPQQYWLLNPANPAGRVKSVLTDGPRISQPWTLERGISPTDGARGVQGPAATDAWALYTTVITPTSITAYLDGTKIGTVASTRTVADFGTGLVAYIGKSSYPDRVWKGGVRDVAIFDTALTDDDVKALVAQGTPSNPEDVDAAAAALVPEAIKKDGKLTVAVSPFAAPLAVYATDNKTPVGNEVDIAVALAESLGLEADIVPTAWADWPLGVDSGKYEAVLSNVTVTEERKLKFDFASYREDKLGFYAKADSSVTKVESAPDVAGKRVIVGSGTNQEAILLRWDEENKKNGLKPVEFQYYDDDSASQLAIQSGRADLTFGPNATAAYKAASDAKTKLVGLVDGGWPLKASIAVTTKKDNGFAAAAQAGLNHLIQDGSYAKILDRWGLSAEAVAKSELNPAGLPKK